MRRLVFLRHAKSDRPAGVEDHERPLSLRGRKASSLMGSYMAKEKLLPDRVLVSTARRTQETWNLACPAFTQDIARTDEQRLYDASADTILEVIRQTPSDVRTLLVIGHNPGLQELALKLISTPGPDLSRLRGKYPTAGLVVIDFDIKRWSEAAAGTGRLDLFTTPKRVLDKA
ncbi:SixA phosphatase family protein [Borborobacter arsenicus]|nr:histidine phosphatase family protein [Pseudaminobacter arsenicus]